jgi:hypothetical protein
MTKAEPFRAAYCSRGPARPGYRIARCQIGCWARLEVCETLPGRPFCPACIERYHAKHMARIEAMAAAALAAERLKAFWHGVGTRRIAGTLFESQPNDWDRF